MPEKSSKVTHKVDHRIKRRLPKPSMRVKDGRQPCFHWFPNALLRDYGAAMGPHAGWVYMALLTHANKEAACWPAHETLTAMTGMSVAQVKVSLKRLAALGLIGVTMRRPKTNVYTVLELPDRPPNSQDTPITPDPTNSQEVAINSQVVAINSQDLAIEQPGGSYEVNILEVEPENQNHFSSSPTPPPTSGDVMMPTTDEEDEEGRFARFWEAYPRHFKRDQARRAFQEAKVDATILDHILQTLTWQPAQWRQDGRRMPPQPADYLNDGMWKDPKPQAWCPPDDTPEAPQTCSEPGCTRVGGRYSVKTCNQHAVARMVAESQAMALTVARFIPAEHRVSDLEDVLREVAYRDHTTEDAHEIARTVVQRYTAEMDAQAIFAVICEVQERAMTMGAQPPTRELELKL